MLYFQDQQYFAGIYHNIQTITLQESQWAKNLKKKQFGR